MLDPEINDSERLYKAIKKSIPGQWNEKLDQPTSAAFKDSQGVSVDRDGGRSDGKIIHSFKESFDLRAVISVTAQQCWDQGTHPIAKPLSDNPYHAEIHRSPEKIMLTAGQAKRLSRLALTDYFKGSSQL